jgi:hypothetical protein
MKRVKTYMCKKVLVSFGNYALSGFADDSHVVIEPNGEGTTKVVGADGEVSRSISPDNTGKIKVSLQQTSDSVPYLQKMFDLDQETGAGIAPLMVTDLSGGVLAQTDQAWITALPTRTYGKATQNIEVQFDCADMTITEV